jgi:hypothetical protein
MPVGRQDAAVGDIAAISQNDQGTAIMPSRQGHDLLRQGPSIPEPTALRKSRMGSPEAVPLLTPSAPRASACDALQDRLLNFEKNEVLRSELQPKFIAAVLAADDSEMRTLDQCFDQAFGAFLANRPQRHWRILADAFKLRYVQEAHKALAEFGLASPQSRIRD